MRAGLAQTDSNDTTRPAAAEPRQLQPAATIAARQARESRKSARSVEWSRHSAQRPSSTAATELAEYLCCPGSGWKCAALSSCARIRNAAASDVSLRLPNRHLPGTWLISILPGASGQLETRHQRCRFCARWSSRDVRRCGGLATAISSGAKAIITHASASVNHSCAGLVETDSSHLSWVREVRKSSCKTTMGP